MSSERKIWIVLRYDTEDVFCLKGFEDRNDAREYADERAGHDWEKWNDDLWHNHDFRQVIEVQYVGIELTEEVIKNE